MADIFEKTLQTRIKLKYATYADWMASSLILKEGEAAICEISTEEEAKDQPIRKIPTILVKYGDGAKPFSQLPWSSALAADVYLWAKESGLYVEEEGTAAHSSDTTTVKALIGCTWKKTTAHPNGALVFTWDNVATLESIEASFEEHKETVSIGFENFVFDDPDYDKENPYNEFFKDQSIDLTLTTTDKDGNEVSSNSLKLKAKDGLAFRTSEDINGNISEIDIIGEKHSHTFYARGNVLAVEIRDQHASLVDDKTLFMTGDNMSITSDSSLNAIVHADKHVTTLSKKDSNDTIFTLEADTATTSNHTTTQNYKLGIDKAELTKLIGETTTSAMEFKGVTATVPTGSINHGDMWKIVSGEEVTVSKEQDAQGVGFTAKTGDAIVAKVDGTSVTWYLIPAGDDADDTWRPIYVDINDNGHEERIDIPQGRELIISSGGNVKFVTEITSNGDVDATLLRGYVDIPNLTVNKESTNASPDTNGLITVVASVKEDPTTNDTDTTTTHGILYKNVENVATSTYVDNKVKEVSDKIDGLDATVTATCGQTTEPETHKYVVKNATGATQTITAPTFGTSVTQTDGKLTAMAGAHVTTDDILQGQYVLVFDCGGAN